MFLLDATDPLCNIKTSFRKTDCMLVLSEKFFLHVWFFIGAMRPMTRSFELWIFVNHFWDDLSHFVLYGRYGEDRKLCGIMVFFRINILNNKKGGWGLAAIFIIGLYFVTSEWNKYLFPSPKASYPSPFFCLTGVNSWHDHLLQIMCWHRHMIFGPFCVMW